MTLPTAHNAWRSILLTGLLVSAGVAAAFVGSSARVTVQVHDERIDVKVGDALFTALHTAKGPRKLYLHPLVSASGKCVTRAFPMEQVKGESTDLPVRDIAQIVNTADSTYRSLDLGLTSRLGGRGQVAVRYTWSSSITHSMFYADANSGVPNEWWPDWDRFEAGPGDFHQPHRMVADATIRFPFDTQISVVTTAASGLPVNPTTGRDNNGDSYTVDRPVGLDRNSFRGPAQLNIDMAAAKRFPLGGRVLAEGRLDVFNLLNRENFIRVNNIYGEGPAPLATFLAPVAGITNADPSRQIQLSVRVIF
jgi:hypothetical protein